MSRRENGIRSTPGLVVCLCWFHPLARTDFRRLLSGNGLRLLERRLDGEGIRSGEVPALPRASVYVVESSATPSLTEGLLAQLVARHPRGRFLVVAESYDQRLAFALLRAGVKGLLTFREASATLRRAVKEVAGEGFWVPRSVLSRFIDSTVRAGIPGAPGLLSLQARLSRRENEVCGLLLENLSNREIADRLHVSERTAKFHVANLLSKCGLKRRADLVVLSYSRLYADGGFGRPPRRSSLVRGG